MKLTCFETVELSDVGRKRKNNEDACLRVPEKGVFCVADGMGGVVGGDLASAAIIDRMRNAFAETPMVESESFSGNVALFRRTANAASRWIREFAEDKVIGQMGSTLVALVFDPHNPRRAVGLHAGDSRLYRYRNGQLQLLTSDHTAAAALAARLGRDAAQIPDKFHNELVRAVGLAERVELEKSLVDVASGDVFLLCSDGLTRMLPEPAITEALKAGKDAPLDQAAKALIAGANEAGGKDNVTVILVRMGDLSGFSEAFEPVDLDDHESLAAAASEGESPTRSGGSHSPDSSEGVHGHTPRTEEDGGPVRGDTPSTDPSGPMRGDTPSTAKAPGPRTPPTAQAPVPVPPPPAEVEKEPPVPAGKRGSGKGVLTGAVIAIIAIAGAYFYFHGGSPAPEPTGENQPPHVAPPVAPVPAPAPAPVPAPAATATQPPPVNNPIPPQQETPAPPQPQRLTGSVMIQSEPNGAAVFFDGRQVGVTPYHTNGLPEGEISYELKTATHAGSGVLSITRGRITTTNVMLTPLSGALTVKSDPAGAEVWIGNEDKGRTPVHLQLPAGQANVTLTVNGLKDQTATTTVIASQDNEMNVVFAYGSVMIKSEPAGAEVRQNGKAVGHTPYASSIVAPGQSSWQLAANGWQPANVLVEVSDHQTKQVSVALQKEKEPLRKWTNNFLNMVFVKVPGADLWAAANRVTLEQFKKVMAGVPNDARENEDGGQQYAVNLTCGMAADFAAKLTEAAKGAESESYHFALPTTNQWMQAFASADQLGIAMSNLKKDKEWCRDGSTWFMAGYVLRDADFSPRPGCKPIDPPPGSEPRQLAIRLVRVP